MPTDKRNLPVWAAILFFFASVIGSIAQWGGASWPIILNVALMLILIAAVIAATLRWNQVVKAVKSLGNKRQAIAATSFGLGVALLGLNIVPSSLPRHGESSGPTNPFGDASGFAAPYGASSDPAPFSGPVNPDPLDRARPSQGDPMDPNTGNFGIPSFGDGSTLAIYHQRANRSTILATEPPRELLESYFRNHPNLPILRNYCRIDPYAGVLAMKILPQTESNLQLLSQGSVNSVVGRAQRYEPELQKLNLSDATSRPVRAISCAPNNCRMTLASGEQWSFRWSSSPQDVLVRAGTEDEQSWADCRCRFSGSFISCDGVEG